MTTFTTRGGVNLTYTLRGDGPLLVCQSGGPGRASTYLQDLGGLAATRTLLLLDSRGTGASERTDRLAMPYLADDLDDLRRHLEVEAFDLLGHSAGAVVAQVFARRYPVARLVLVTPSGRLQGVSGRDVSGPETYGVWNDAAQAHAAHCDAEMDRRAEREFYDFTEADVPGGSITAETLIVAGGADELTPVAAAEAIQAEIPGSTVTVMEGVGHYPWVERPETFAMIVEDFLSRPRT